MKVLRNSLSLSLILWISVQISYSSDIKLDTINDYNGWGWQALVIDNGYIQLVIIPEIGGRVMHYGFEGDEYMAINESQMGINYNPETNKTGPWVSWGYGGYKVWPAPQSVWNWPPPPYLCWGNYSYNVEHASADSVIIYLESEEETVRAPGLVFTRRFKAYKNSTLVIVEQGIINNNTTDKNWSVWDVTQAVVSHNNGNDYTNFSVYFPANKSDYLPATYGNMENSVVQVTNGLSKYSYKSTITNAKIFYYLDNGWTCFTDERDAQSYVKLFDVKAGTHPDDGANFEIYAGNKYIEIEVLSPIQKITANGGSYSYNENWYAAHVEGTVNDVNHCGIVQNKLSYNDANKNISGSYGIFTSGSVKLEYRSSGNELLGSSDPVNVEAAEKYQLNATVELPANTAKIQLICSNLTGENLGILDQLTTSGTGLSQNQVSTFKILPSQVRRGEDLLIINQNLISDFQEVHLSISNLSGQIVYSNKQVLVDGKCSVNSSELPTGSYILTISTREVNAHKQFIVY